jgi:hypothetical protein
MAADAIGELWKFRIQHEQFGAWIHEAEES